MERGREAYWLRYPGLRLSSSGWRAAAVRHSFHVLPGESILDLGAGSGLWTEHLTSVCRGEAFITAAVFNEGLVGAGVPPEASQHDLLCMSPTTLATCPQNPSTTWWARPFSVTMRTPSI